MFQSTLRAKIAATACATALALTTPSLAQDEFLEEGGSVSSGFELSRDEEFLEDGGSISNPESVLIVPLAVEEDDPFLEDGGSVTTEPDFSVRLFRDLEKPRTVRRREGSIIHFRGAGTPTAVARRGLAPQFRYGDGASSTRIALNRRERPSFAYGIGPVDTGPKIIDVEAERLDRQPLGADGIDVTYTGGAKVIRIAPGYSRSGKANAPDDEPFEAAGGWHEPWSLAWYAYCDRTYASFDPDRGTYVAEDGRVRFCIAE